MRNFDMVNRLLFVAIILLMVLVATALLYTFLTFGVLGLIGALIIGPASVFITIKFFRANTVTVQEGTVKVVERLGAFSRILYPGSSLLLDPFDHVRATIETSEQQHEFLADEVLVGSSATPKLRMLIRYRILRREVDGRESADEEAALAPLWDAWTAIHSANPLVDDEKLLDAALYGLMAAAGDAHTDYMDPETYARASEA